MIGSLIDSLFDHLLGKLFGQYWVIFASVLGKRLAHEAFNAGAYNTTKNA